MQYTLIPPTKELSAFISHFWTCTWDKDDESRNHWHYVIANRLTEITFAFDGKDLVFSNIQGHTQNPNRYKVPEFNYLLGVAFHSFAVPQLFRSSALELNNELLSLDTLLNQNGKLLNEQIALANSTNERIEILSKHFTAALRESNSCHNIMAKAVQEIGKQQGNVKVEALADQFCLSQRQFNRRFKEFSGFSPKVYSRIVRFESVLNNCPNPVSFTETAYQHSYADQAHFTNEFKALSGYSPRDFWRIGGAEG